MLGNTAGQRLALSWLFGNKCMCAGGRGLSGGIKEKEFNWKFEIWNSKFRAWLTWRKANTAGQKETLKEKFGHAWQHVWCGQLEMKVAANEFNRFNDFKLTTGPKRFPFSNIGMLKCAEHPFRSSRAGNKLQKWQTFKALVQHTVGPDRSVLQHDCVRVPKCYQTARDKRHRKSCVCKRDREGGRKNNPEVALVFVISEHGEPYVQSTQPRAKNLINNWTFDSIRELENVLRLKY